MTPFLNRDSLERVVRRRLANREVSIFKSRARGLSLVGRQEYFLHKRFK